MTKKCKKCGIEKDIQSFSNTELKRGDSSRCRSCMSKYGKDYYKNNKEEVALSHKKYRDNNLIAHQTRNKIYYENNKEQVLLRTKEYKNEKRINDVSFKLKDVVSCSIRSFLKKINFSKNNESILKYLSYSIEELKSHLESLFEPWMTWENYGSYKKDIWDNNDQLTWTWNIDHIIPQSKFKYTSMEDQSFHDCWSLSNLRPLSSKQNLLDGNRRNFND